MSGPTAQTLARVVVAEVAPLTVAEAIDVIRAAALEAVATVRRNAVLHVLREHRARGVSLVQTGILADALAGSFSSTLLSQTLTELVGRDVVFKVLDGKSNASRASWGLR